MSAAAVGGGQAPTRPLGMFQPLDLELAPVGLHQSDDESFVQDRCAGHGSLPAGMQLAALEHQAGAALRAAAWLALLFAGYGLQRALCAAGLPYDCDSASAADVYAALTALGLAGGALGWLASVYRPERFVWLVAPRQAYMGLAFFATLPVYSAVSNVPAFRTSLPSWGSWGPGMAALAALGAAAALAALAWHMRLAWRAGSGSAGSRAVESSNGNSAAWGSRFKSWRERVWRGLGSRHAMAAAAAAVMGAGAGVAAAPSSPAAHQAPAGAEAGEELPANEDSALMPHSGSSAPQLSALAIDGTATADQAHTGRDGFSGSRGRGHVASMSQSHGAARFRGGPYDGGSGGGSAVGRIRAAGRARRRAGLRSLGLYLLPRLAVLAYFAAWFLAVPASGAASLHLHHYALGWGLAAFAAFNHPVSGLLLAIGTGIFVQGGGAYGFDPFFSVPAPGGCVPASSDTGQLTCAFWAARPFDDLRFCSDKGQVPWFDCTLAWPWPDTAVAKPRLPPSTSPPSATPPQPAAPTAQPAHQHTGHSAPSG